MQTPDWSGEGGDCLGPANRRTEAPRKEQQHVPNTFESGPLLVSSTAAVVVGGASVVVVVVVVVVGVVAWILLSVAAMVVEGRVARGGVGVRAE